MARKRKLEASPTADRAEMRRLLEAAKADHWDDGPRLALADWLEENGGEADRTRAEVIRLQLDTANGGPDWRLSVERLREKFVREWVEPHAGFFTRKMPECERGLLVAAVAARNWMSGEADEAWEWVETARIEAIDARDVPRLLASARMSTVPRLEFVGGKPMGVVGLRDAVGSPERGGLRSLSLTTFAHNLPDLGRALRPGLEELSVIAVEMGTRDWVSLFNSPGVDGLRSLSLGICHLTDEGAAALAASPGLAGLRRLSLERTGLTASGLAALGGLPFRHLTIDDWLTENESWPDAFLGLVGTPCAAVLEELRLHGPHWARLPPLPTLPRLRRLALTRLQPANPENLPGGLDELDLTEALLGPEGAAALASMGRPGPRTFHLRGCSLGDAGLKHLAAWPGLARVRYLDVSLNDIGDEGLRSLAKSPHASSLEALSISENRKITPVGVEALMRSPLGPRLRWLSLADVPAQSEEAFPLGLRELYLGWGRLRDLGTKGMARLRAALPGCAIG
jgi:uncharacterized protein (TIGR02996 family)